MAEKWVRHSLFSAGMLCLISSGGWFAGVGTLLAGVPQHFFCLPEFCLVERLHRGESYVLLPAMGIHSSSAASAPS